MLDQDQVIEAISCGALRAIPKNFCFDYEDYALPNRLKRHWST